MKRQFLFYITRKQPTYGLITGVEVIALDVTWGAGVIKGSWMVHLVVLNVMFSFGWADKIPS